VYDALTSKRCYKDAFSHEKSVNIILEGNGSHFDPDVVLAFQETELEFQRIRKEYIDTE
jgi:putative two-component system response regulator